MVFSKWSWNLVKWFYVVSYTRRFKCLVFVQLAYLLTAELQKQNMGIAVRGFFCETDALLLPRQQHQRTESSYNSCYKSYRVCMALYRKSIAMQRRVICHMGITQPRWTCLALTPAKQAGIRFTYPGVMKGWVDFCGWLYTMSAGQPPIQVVSTW